MRTNLKLFCTAMLLAGTVFAWAQEKNISGQVTDSNGFPVADAYVYVEGSENGVYTDADGHYSLSVNEGDTVVVEFIGLETKTVSVGSAMDYNVVLSKEGAIGLGEFVQMGYRELSKNDQTGSVVQLDAEELEKVQLASVDQALQGKVAGLNISASSGTPGSQQQIVIRGFGSINASNNPLYVIDGVPMADQNPDISSSASLSSFSPLSLLNSNDIESVTVLKDASATAAYGARGSNGVIVITTKKGKRGDTKFNFSSQFGWSDYAVEQPKPLTGAQREKLFYDALFNSYGSAYNFDRDGAQQFYENNVSAFGDSYLVWNQNGRKEANWGEELKNKFAGIHNYNISAAGGSGKETFFASAGYYNSEAVVKGADFERISARLNYGRDFSDKIKFETSNQFGLGTQNGILEQSAYFANPFLTRYFVPQTTPIYNADGSLNLNTGSLYNTLYLAEEDVRKRENLRLINNTSISYEILKNLTLKSVASFDYTNAWYHEYRNRTHGQSVDVGGYAYQADVRTFNWVTQNSIAYNNKFGNHKLDLMFVQEYQKNKESYVAGDGSNFPKDGFIYLDNTSAEKSSFGGFEDYANASYSGLLNYSYDNRYILDGTVRREGSSIFAPGERFGTFYSVGGAWNIHNESFMDGNTFNMLKLRASYGLSGNSGFDLNKYQRKLGLDADYNSQGAFYPSEYGNEKLEWEKNNTLDVGLDFGLFNDRVSGQVTYYEKKTFDLLSYVPVTRTSGFSNIAANAGDIVNKGVEAMLNVNVVDTESVKLKLSANYASLDNEVTNLPKDINGDYLTTETGTRVIDVGLPLYAWKMRSWAGVDPANGDPLWYIDPENSNATTNNWSEAKKVLQGGSALPTYTGGFSTELWVKNFFLNASVFISGGNKVYQDWATYTLANNFNSILRFNGTSELVNSWTPENTNTNMPRMFADNSGMDAQNTSSRFLFDGDFIRLRNIEFGYNIPKQWLENVGIDGLRLSVTGLNLYTWVKDKDLKYDPEVRTDGFTRLSSPPVKQFTFNVNVQF